MRILFTGLILSGIAAVLAFSSLRHLPPSRALPRPVIVVEERGAVPLSVPPVLVINGFETENDRHNFIAGYETPGGIKRSLSGSHAVHGTSSLKVVWREKRWGQLATTHFPQDWDGYETLAFEVYNAGTPFKMEVRVGEWYNRNTFDPNSSRFTRTVLMAAGTNSVRIPLEDVARKINLGASRKIIHFSVTDPKKEPRLFYLDFVRLER